MAAPCARSHCLSLDGAIRINFGICARKLQFLLGVYPKISQKPLICKAKAKAKAETNTSKAVKLSSTTSRTLKREKAIARVSQMNSEGNFSEQVIYLMELGMSMDEIKGIARIFPDFLYYNLDRKIKPVVELLTDLGVLPSQIPKIIRRSPLLCGVSLSKKLKPSIAYLENIGVDKEQWAKVIWRFPALLLSSRQKVEIFVDYLRELGVSEKSIGKILTRNPQILALSLDENLKPTVEYFQSIGVDVASLIRKSPQTFHLSIEENLKLVTEFLLERGFSIDEIRDMVDGYATLYTLSLNNNLIPKWNFFLTMGYCKSDLVKFPFYFGYSLQGRIKPRYELMTECGVRLTLSTAFSLSDSKFASLLEKKMQKF